MMCPSPHSDLSKPVGSWVINGFKSTGSASGQWVITNAIGQIKDGTLKGGSIANSHFTLSGTEQDDDECLAQTPATVTFTGSCGTDVTVQFRASNGESGTLIGNVACS